MTSVLGWVWQANLIRFLQQLSQYVGYAYDEWDQQALIGALDRTDAESLREPFEYPIEGSPRLLVRLDRPADIEEISVRVDGDIDEVLRARIETLLDVL